MSAKTPVVSRMLARHIAEARAAGSNVDIERSVDQIRQLILLARDLEGHCEAMYQACLHGSTRDNFEAGTDYGAWKREQLGSTEQK